MNFEAEIKATLNTQNAKDTYDTFKRTIEADAIKVKLDVDFIGNNSNLMKTLQNQFQYVGKNAGQALAKGVQGSAGKVGQNIGKIISSASKQAISNANFKDIAKIEEAISTRSYDTKISSISNKLGTYSSSSAQYQTVSNSLKNVETAYENLKIAKDAYDADTSTSNYEQLISANKELVSSIKLTENELKILSNEQSKVLSPSIIASSKKSFTSYLENNTKAAKAYKEEIALLEQELNSMSTAQDKINFDTKFKNLQNRAIAEGNTGKSFIAEIGKSFQRIAVFANAYRIIQRIPYTLNQMYQEVTKVDTAMTNLYKVTDETTSAYENFQQSASTSAKELGRDISSYIEQTSEWAKLGYNMSQSAELAKTSSIYANVGEVDDKTAVSDLVTVMKAYNMQDSQAMNITDMLNELGNNYATSAGDLGAGINRMASTMSMSNVSLEKSLAILTGGAEITQDAEELGNAIKVSVLRMRGQKGQLEELGENADDIESVSKMQTQILNMTKGAVNIMDSADPTAFRDYYDVMADIAEILPKLDQTRQANLIETLFGKNRANQGQAILQAFQSGQIQKAYQTALNSAGSAQKEQERWLNSIEAKQQQFAASFQELSTTVINSDFAKGLLDSGTNLLELLTQLIDKVGSFKTLIASLGGGWLTKNGFGKRNAALYKVKQNNRRFINVESFIAINMNKPNNLYY